ncbi:pyridoxal-phosphate dependent enzyme [bacterium]|nr:pyridoxal-phosphate dependent enzyme [bacterium]
MIDLTMNESVLGKAVGLAKERGIVLPTIAQQRDPSLIPAAMVDRLRSVGLWDVDPANLFRITWQNEPVEHGGGFGPVNYIELPSSLTGVDARIVALVGKWFPTGAHKVGAAYGCLVPRLVTGQFDPVSQKAVWPSTGNYCRGGAYDSALLGCSSVAILPEGMSRERFDWLKTVAGEIIRTPGTESNVKEIFDKCNEMRRSGEDVVIFNQFDELGNYMWHYAVTGDAMVDVAEAVLGDGDRLAGVVLTTGSAGTIASGDRVKQAYPGSRLVAGEALQCPTLLMAGFGEHRIEGIGDKHVPWIHNIRNTDAVVALDDEGPMSILRLFNEPDGIAYLAEQGVPAGIIESLPLFGISGIANMLGAIRMARHYELTSSDVVLTVLTDSVAMYGSRVAELQDERGPFASDDAAAAHHRYVLGMGRDRFAELGYDERKRIHNLKYFTWVEQQGRETEELNRQWDDPGYWTSVQALVPEIDRRIEDFNAEVGV